MSILNRISVIIPADVSNSYYDGRLISPAAIQGTYACYQDGELLEDLLSPPRKFPPRVGAGGTGASPHARVSALIPGECLKPETAWRRETNSNFRYESEVIGKALDRVDSLASDSFPAAGHYHPAFGKRPAQPRHHNPENSHQGGQPTPTTQYDALKQNVEARSSYTAAYYFYAPSK